MRRGRKVEIMPRVTQAQKLEQANEQQALAFFEEVLRGLPDPRRKQGLRYPLRTVIVIALMAMVCGCDDAEAMELWGETNSDWLDGFLEMPHGSPSQDVFLAVFCALDPKAFSTALRAWANFLSLRLQQEGKHIAVDGKTSRRSFHTSNGRPAIHTVSAWLADGGLVLGQQKTDVKSNEITAIPELLKLLDLRGATVTTDAMGCQTEIAKTIVEGGGNYLLAVKGNQPVLYENVVETCREAADELERASRETPETLADVFEETDKGHGRVETRKVIVCRDLRWMDSRSRWPNLGCVIEVTRERTDLMTQKTSMESAYYIGSDASLTAASAAKLIRRHWSIENELHWVLDFAFREDESRHRARNTAQNMTILRHWALNLINQDAERKVGVATARKRAGWDRNYLLHLLVRATS
jgi:predicted transposase YbfD/YdcC